MKISINAIKEIYKQNGVDPSFLPADINELVTKIGAQLGEVEEVIDLGKKYKGILVAKVISCEPHPNADKLKICKIDVGKGHESVQIVCGAPNVREGMLAAWIPPGATVPVTFDKEPFILEARELRGELSKGMLAGTDELYAHDDHNGLLEIDKDAQPGDSFTEVYKLDDYIIDIENKMFTHRPDCFGLLGIARELAGIYGVHFKSPDWYQPSPELPQPEVSDLKLEIINEIPQLVPRFSATVIKDVKVGPSPVWLQIALSKFGIKSINNIVDLTNFYMVYSGQPLHAYDYDKVAGLSKNDATIKVRLAKEEEKIKLLNGKEAGVGKDTIVIATDETAIGIGGVIGGTDTEVDHSTKNIVLECANFDAYSIRRTSMAHGIFTDAVTRFSKGQSTHQVLPVLAKVSQDMIRMTGGQLASKVFDLKNDLHDNKSIEMTPDFINIRLGLDLQASQIESILKNVEFEVENKSGNLHITAPFWRTDIEIPEDIVEEVGRLYGYDHLPSYLPKRSTSPAVINPELKAKELIRASLAALGANEVLTYSFVHGDLLDKVGQDKDKSFKIKNALSPDLQYYRQSLTPSLLEKVHPNIKAGFDNFALFELGKVHIKGQEEDDNAPKEFSRVALVVASKNSNSTAYYAARDYLVNMLESFGVEENKIVFEPIDKNKKDPAAVYYLDGRSATVKIDGKTAGRIGEYKQEVSNKLKLPDFCAGFELNLESLLHLNSRNHYQPLSRYPDISQDLTLKTPTETNFAEVLNEIKKSADAHKPEDVSVKVLPIDIYQDKDDPKHKSLTFRLQLTSKKRTLTTQEANLLIESVKENI